MRSVYGPVLSRRFGLSLGIDPTLPPKKCSFDCIYCQLGPTIRPVYEPYFSEELVSPEKLRKDLEEYLPRDFDVVTFSGSGEPTVNARIRELLAVVREFTEKPVYILTNGSFLSLDHVARAVAEFDHVSAKLDARDQRSYLTINKPFRPREFENFLRGHETIKRYASRYSVQIMYTRVSRPDVIDLAMRLDPDEIYVTIPYRANSRLVPENLAEIADYCREHGIKFFERRKAKGYLTEEAVEDLLKRRPMSVAELAEALNVDVERLKKLLDSMRRFGKIKIEGDRVFLERAAPRGTLEAFPRPPFLVCRP